MALSAGRGSRESILLVLGASVGSIVERRSLARMALPFQEASALDGDWPRTVEPGENKLCRLVLEAKLSAVSRNGGLLTFRLAAGVDTSTRPLSCVSCSIMSFRRAILCAAPTPVMAWSNYFASVVFTKARSLPLACLSWTSSVVTSVVATHSSRLERKPLS